jgi:hypothetical protein
MLGYIKKLATRLRTVCRKPEIADYFRVARQNEAARRRTLRVK